MVSACHGSTEHQAIDSVNETRGAMICIKYKAAFEGNKEKLSKRLGRGNADKIARTVLVNRFLFELEIYRSTLTLRRLYGCKL